MKRAIAALVVAVGVLTMPAVAHAGLSTYCGRLTTQTIMTCVPPGHGPAELWDVLDQEWQPTSESSAPVIIVWVEPNVYLPDLAHDAEKMRAYRKLVDVAVSLLKTKDAASRAVSEKRQNEIFDRIYEAGRRTR